MANGVIIDKVSRNSNQTTNQIIPTFKGNLLMMEANPKEITGPENPKFQYIYGHLIEVFHQRVDEVSKQGCQNRNNLITLIEWLSNTNPASLAGNLILQRDDIMVKRINGTLFIAPCKLKIDVPKPTKFISGIIDQFEIEKLTAELEILPQQQFRNGQYVRPTWSLVDEINQEKLSIQFEYGIDKASEFIQEELNNLATNWKLVSFCISVFILTSILVIVNLKLKLICIVFKCFKRSQQRANPTEAEFTYFKG
uniref:Uma2 domain-containing protein n=1 Tax=Loa loa TaxID=7209 RepID=A0A1I7VR76_LOALO